jgi:hypothetical protein
MDRYRLRIDHSSSRVYAMSIARGTRRDRGRRAGAIARLLKSIELAVMGLDSGFLIDVQP